MDGNDDSRLEIIIHGACRIGQMVHRVWKLSSRVVHLIGAHINYAISIGGLYRCSTLDFRLPRLSQGEGGGRVHFRFHVDPINHELPVIQKPFCVFQRSIIGIFIQITCRCLVGIFFFNRSQILFNILIFNKYLVNM